MFKKLALAATIALIANSAVAAGPSRMYLGADLGRTKFEGISDRSTSGGVFAGYRLNDTFAIEGGAHRLGSISFAKVDHYGLSLVATEFAVGEFSNVGMFARAGYGHTRASGCLSGFCADVSRNKYFLGIGLIHNTTDRLMTRFEAQHPASGTDNLSVSLVYSF